MQVLMIQMKKCFYFYFTPLNKEALNVYDPSPFVEELRVVTSNVLKQNG
jgi:hypothetical protein